MRGIGLRHIPSAVCLLIVISLPASKVAGAARVVINEVHYHPADDTNSCEFIEVYNFGGDAVDLRGWMLAGGVSFIFPPNSLVRGGSYLVVAAEPAILRANYGLSPELVLGPYNGSLSNGGERIELWTSRGYLMSFIHYADADPWPEAPDGLGPSLERISTLREEDDPGAWAASIAVGGTPGALNSVWVDDPQPPATDTPLVPEGATWRFFRASQSPPANWAARGFDDGTWESGPAGFGYDDNDDATVLSDMRGGYSTLYIRHTFAVSNPSAIESLSLSVLYDDGYVAYLNGTEVDRVNVGGSSGTPLAYDAVTLTTVEPPARRTIDLTASIGLLVAGPNVLAVHGVNAARDNPDFSLHPSLTASVAAGAVTEVDYVVPGDEWRFFRGRSAPPTDWRGLDFVDGEWEIGPSGFGYGDNDDATVLGDMQGAYLTVFIRIGFQVADASKVRSLTLTVDYDDGFIAYLNGVEVARANAPNPGFDRPAGTSHEAGTPVSFDVGNLASLLRTGFNVLAIEGHNATLASTDFTLIPSVKGELLPDDLPPPPDPPPARPPRDVVINEIYSGAGGSGWVELYNVTGQPLDMAGRRLQLFPRSMGVWEFPAGSLVPAHDRMVVTETELGFSLVDVATLILSTHEDYYVDGLNPRTTPAGHSTGRWPDGADNRYVLSTPTRDAANTIQLESRVVINEIQYHPADANAGGEFIELYNRSTTDGLDLSDWSFTRGVEYTFPAGTVIGPGGYLVIAQKPDAAATYYGISRPLGPYTGSLANDAETLLLRDALNSTVDRVRFADEGSWPEDADGLGPSAELVNPSVENRYGPAWAASAGEGTPGARNSRFQADPLPVVVDVAHAPVVPLPSDTVLVTATISDERSITSATLFWQDDGAGSSTQVSMVDDGAGDDGIAANGVYGARIPARPDRTIVLFWIRAQAEGGQTVTVPAPRPQITDPKFLYQVEAPGTEQPRPVYRLIMKAADLNALRTRGNSSDVDLDCTFVDGGRFYYNRGVHYRGQSARSCNPLSYRVEFDHDVDFHGIKRLNLNGCNTQRQWIGLDFLSRTGIPSPQSWYRKLSIDASLESGNHLRVEAVDDQFLDRVLPDDAGGNLYRGEHQADLSYRGTNFSSYQPYYIKHTNEEVLDWSDIVDLCFRFDSDTTSNADFPAAIEAGIDINEWALYFAAYAVLGSTEGAITLDTGDDYYIYRRPSDGRWIILPWDLDSCFNQADQVLFRPTVDQIERFLEHPRYAPLYWCYVDSMMDDVFAADIVDSRVDHLVPLFNATVVGQLRQFVPARRQYIVPRISSNLTVTVTAGARVCGDALLVSQPAVSLEGLSPGCGTTEVRVGDEAVAYDPQTNRWSAGIEVTGAGPITITAVDKDGVVVARRVLQAEIPGPQTSLPATISSSRQLLRSQSPYRASGTVTVSPGVTLTFEPGVTLVFDTGATLVVEGVLVAEGTLADPVYFTTDACSARQEGILLKSTSTGSRFSQARFSGLLRAGSFAGAVVVDGATVVMDQVTFLGSGDGVSIEVRGNGDLTLADSRIQDFAMGIQVSGATATVRSSEFREAGDVAVRFNAGATGTVERCVFRDNTRGVVVAGAASVDLSYLTVFGSDLAFDLREEAPESGPGTVRAHSVIVWNTNQAIAEDPSSPADVTFSNLSGPDLRPGQGNISTDPLFHDAGAGDFRLSFFSPSKGTGKDGSDMGALPYEPLGETGTFRRCDSNGDGENDLSDAVFTLLELFKGASASPCPAASDCNADGTLNITDAIFDLGYLFLQGMPPPPPFPACEVSPVELCGGNFCLEP